MSNIEVNLKQHSFAVVEKDEGCLVIVCDRKTGTMENGDELRRAYGAVLAPMFGGQERDGKMGSFFNTRTGEVCFAIRDMNATHVEAKLQENGLTVVSASDDQKMGRMYERDEFRDEGSCGHAPHVWSARFEDPPPSPPDRGGWSK